MLCDLRLCLLIDQLFSFLLERCFILLWMFWEENKASLFLSWDNCPHFCPHSLNPVAVSQIHGVTTPAPHTHLHHLCNVKYCTIIKMISNTHTHTHTVVFVVGNNIPTYQNRLEVNLFQPVTKRYSNSQSSIGIYRNRCDTLNALFVCWYLNEER